MKTQVLFLLLRGRVLNVDLIQDVLNIATGVVGDDDLLGDVILSNIDSLVNLIDE